MGSILIGGCGGIWSGLGCRSRYISEFNWTQLEMPVTLNGLRRSMEVRRSYSERAKHGVVVNRRLSRLWEVGAFGA